MKINEVRSTRYFASPVLNHLMTWGFALIQETLTLMSMSQSMSLVEVVCDVSSIIVIFCPAPNLEVFGQHFGRFFVRILGWKDLCNSLPYHPLEIVELGVEHSGGRRRGGIGAAANLQARRLGWWLASRFYLLIIGLCADWTDLIVVKHIMPTPDWPCGAPLNNEPLFQS